MCNMGTVSQEISGLAGAGAAAARSAVGEAADLHFSSDLRPLVVWNVTQRCNLACPHCYIDASGGASAGELTTAEARAMVDDLAAVATPVLLFSGGEPLLRDDTFDLAARAAEKGVRPVLSTNGLLLSDDVVKRIRDSGFQYVGVSVDGTEEYHDRFRAAPGAWRRSWEGAERCVEHGIRSGIRFTLTRDNAAQLPAVLDETLRRGIPRFCMYHLVYAGRGADIADRDLSADQKRSLIEWLADRARDLGESRTPVEILTTDNHADGVYLYQRLLREGADGEEIMDLLRRHGGCSAGRKFACVGPTGEVHPCQFWTHVSLGDVRERPFSEIWQDEGGLLGELRSREGRLGGKCGRCAFQEVCGGCRVRAKAVTGDAWAEDPACYLTEEEIAG
jgi:radical SAM protein with 4Fe4S-binding SPASM domain